MKLTEDIFDHGPDPENPGWRHWNLKDQSLFNGAVMGRMITRVDGDGPDGPPDDEPPPEPRRAHLRVVK